MYHKKAKHHDSYLLEKCESFLASTKNNTKNQELRQTQKCHTDWGIHDINEYPTPHMDTDIHENSPKTTQGVQHLSLLLVLMFILKSNIIILHFTDYVKLVVTLT